MIAEGLSSATDEEREEVFGKSDWSARLTPATQHSQENAPVARELTETNKLKIENMKLKITNHNLSAHLFQEQGKQLEAEKNQLEKELGIEIK